jgi:hypothetical protein
MVHTVPLLACFDVGFLVIELDKLRERVWLTHLVHIDDAVTSPDVERIGRRLSGNFGSGGIGCLGTLLLYKDGALVIEVAVVLTLECTFFFEGCNVLC